MTVVICTYSLERHHQLVACVASVLDQASKPDQVVVVIDHNHALAELVANEMAGVEAVANRFRAGLSGARNTGVLAAQGDVVVFLDDDASAEPGWLAALIAPYDDARTMGNGGHVEPEWLAPRPRWFPDEFLWVVGCSYRGLPRTVVAVRNPIGCNMSFRRSVLLEAGLFRHGVGRVGTNLSGCEETELSIRAAQRRPGDRILLVPDARVRHLVTAARTTVSYYLRRCYAEGLSKAILARAVGQLRSSSTERRYLVRALPSGIARGLGDTLRRGRPDGLARSAMIVAGTASTAVGYGIGRLRTFREAPVFEADNAS